MMAMMAVMSPKKIKDVRELSRAVEEWEVRVKNLKTEHELGSWGWTTRYARRC